MIDIKVYKNEDEIICYSMNCKEYKFAYESFEVLIDVILRDNEEVEITCDDEYIEYKKLLIGIIQGVKTEDFRNAVKSAEDSKKNLEDLEHKITL